MDFSPLAGDSYAQITASKFLERKINSFDSNIPTVIYNIPEGGFDAVKKKALITSAPRPMSFATAAYISSPRPKRRIRL